MTDSTTSSPWQWPREWVRDQSFWRDVATRTVAGLIVALVIFVIGVLAGVIAPSFLLAVGIVVGTGVLLVIFARWWGPMMAQRAQRGGRFRFWSVTAVQAAVIFGLVFLYAILCVIVSQSWRSW